ncbi:gliding motility protein [Streptomyces sp. NPDC006487]|uniref:gliding motility protein n=1 Tax=unclassified Streptomyces TaxID=2593676 RepID=UPI0022510A03|nr:MULTISPECIES: gliding motility protein [unclassified Streptomyces]MCX5404198.1 gliding motility protein [Streptomyces sp. NBC_00086]
MGILDRLLGRKTQATTEEAVSADLTAESATADEAGTEQAVAEESAVEAVEIPKQQSAEVSADSEAAEGART